MDRHAELDPLPADMEEMATEEPPALGWCCTCRSCLCGSQPFLTRSLDCIAQCFYWYAGMYHPGGHFSRWRWNCVTAVNEVPAGLNRHTGVYSRDHVLPTPTHNIPIRVYTPPTLESVQAQSTPVMLYLHGGGFCLGSRSMSQMQFLCNQFSSLGLIVVAVSYRLAPEHPFPAGLVDCYHVAQWIHDAKQSGLLLPEQADRSRFILAGDSAGGNLACVLSSLCKDGLTADLARGPVIAVAHEVLIYPALFVDPSLLALTPKDLAEEAAFIPAPVIAWFRKSYAVDLERLGRTDRRMAPLLAGLAGMPPTTIVAAGLDKLRHENRFVAQEFAKAGVPCAFRMYENVPHGFITFSFLPESHRAIEDISKDLAHVLTPGTVFQQSPVVGGVAMTPYGAGLVAEVNNTNVKVELNWGLPSGASAVATVAASTLRGSPHVGSRVRVGVLGEGLVLEYREVDSICEVDLGWGLCFAHVTNVVAV